MSRGTGTRKELPPEPPEPDLSIAARLKAARLRPILLSEAAPRDSSVLVNGLRTAPNNVALPLADGRTLYVRPDRVHSYPENREYVYTAGMGSVKQRNVVVGFEKTEVIPAGDVSRLVGPTGDGSLKFERVTVGGSSTAGSGQNAWLDVGHHFLLEVAPVYASGGTPTRADFGALDNAVVEVPTECRATFSGYLQATKRNQSWGGWVDAALYSVPESLYSATAAEGRTTYLMPVRVTRAGLANSAQVVGLTDKDVEATAAFVLDDSSVVIKSVTRVSQVSIEEAIPELFAEVAVPVPPAAPVAPAPLIPGLPALPAVAVEIESSPTALGTVDALTARMPIYPFMTSVVPKLFGNPNPVKLFTARFGGLRVGVSYLMQIPSEKRDPALAGSHEGATNPIRALSYRLPEGVQSESHGGAMGLPVEERTRPPAGKNDLVQLNVTYQETPASFLRVVYAGPSIDGLALVTVPSSGEMLKVDCSRVNLFETVVAPDPAAYTHSLASIVRAGVEVDGVRTMLTKLYQVALTLATPDEFDASQPLRAAARIQGNSGPASDLSEVARAYWKSLTLDMTLTGIERAFYTLALMTDHVNHPATFASLVTVASHLDTIAEKRDRTSEVVSDLLRAVYGETVTAAAPPKLPAVPVTAHASSSAPQDLTFYKLVSNAPKEATARDLAGIFVTTMVESYMVKSSDPWARAVLDWARDETRMVYAGPEGPEAGQGRGIYQGAASVLAHIRDLINSTTDSEARYHAYEAAYALSPHLTKFSLLHANRYARTWMRARSPQARFSHWTVAPETREEMLLDVGRSQGDSDAFGRWLESRAGAENSGLPLVPPKASWIIRQQFRTYTKTATIAKSMLDLVRAGQTVAFTSVPGVSEAIAAVQYCIDYGRVEETNAEAVWAMADRALPSASILRYMLAAATSAQGGNMLSALMNGAVAEWELGRSESEQAELAMTVAKNLAALEEKTKKALEEKALEEVTAYDTGNFGEFAKWNEGSTTRFRPSWVFMASELKASIRALVEYYSPSDLRPHSTQGERFLQAAEAYVVFGSTPGVQQQAKDAIAESSGLGSPLGYLLTAIAAGVENPGLLCNALVNGARAQWEIGRSIEYQTEIVVAFNKAEQVATAAAVARAEEFFANPPLMDSAPAVTDSSGITTDPEPKVPEQQKQVAESSATEVNPDMFTNTTSANPYLTPPAAPEAPAASSPGAAPAAPGAPVGDPTINMLTGAAPDALMMIAALKSQGLLRDITRKIAEKMVGPDNLAILDTKLGVIIERLLTPIAIHLVMTHGPGAKVPGAEYAALAAGHAFRGQLVVVGAEYIPEVSDMWNLVTKELVELVQLGKALSSMGQGLSLDAISTTATPAAPVANANTGTAPATVNAPSFATTRG